MLQPQYNNAMLMGFDTIEINLVWSYQQLNIATKSVKYQVSSEGRGPLIEDGLWLKTIFDGRGPLIEETTFGLRP